jgi:hemoglobin-like flavoprotein
MITDEQKALVQGSWAKVAPSADAVAKIFYAKLFELDPAVEPLFTSDIEAQGKKLMKTLSFAVNGLNNLDRLVPVVEDLGRRHKGYGVVPKHYETVAAALIDTLAKGLGDDFTDETKDAWVAVYTVLSTTMISAASDN